MRNIKKWIVFALILTFLISLPACASSSASLLTAEEVAALEEQVAADWGEHTGFPYEMKFIHFYYYGTNNGYHIIYFRSVYANSCESHIVEIAGYQFDSGIGSQLMAYKNGVFFDLQEAYYSGLVSKKAVAKAAELHAARKNATE
jgi:hypothetical protein